MVTGGTGGFGSALCRAYAGEGARVVVVARDRARGEHVVASARAALPKGSGGGAELLLCDLSSLQSVRAAARKFRADHPTLDVLVHTASVFRRHREVTAEGFERMFATNHLGPFLLTLELMRSMQEAVAGARIFVVTAPATTQVDFDDLQGEEDFSAFEAFGATKVMQLMFTLELARKVDPPAVTVNAFHPGVLKTGLMHDAPFIARLITKLVGRKPDRAAEALRDLTIDEMTSRVSGQLFKGRTTMDMPAVARVTKDRERLWEISERLVGIGDPSPPSAHH